MQQPFQMTVIQPPSRASYTGLGTRWVRTHQTAGKPLCCSQTLPSLNCVCPSELLHRLPGLQEGSHQEAGDEGQDVLLQPRGDHSQPHRVEDPEHLQPTGALDGAQCTVSLAGAPVWLGWDRKPFVWSFPLADYC